MTVIDSTALSSSLPSSITSTVSLSPLVHLSVDTKTTSTTEAQNITNTITATNGNTNVTTDIFNDVNTAITNSAAKFTYTEPPASLSRTEINAHIMEKIYCGGSLLEAVQKANIFHDCKHFVDMPLKSDAESTLHDWQELVDCGQVDNISLRQFVETHFDEPGGELDNFQPSDFDPECRKFETITCPSYRQWAKELHRKWPTLCRKTQCF
ncbi:unnamed protein product [Thelazia callipaeda]|uniref:Trehalase n=1 Tax=Thelazia callipaeda TaxID=103827 RepID=A0A0N5CZW1_THECL|nr:unnamed protein product [Thelazia callipaeda]